MSCIVAVRGKGVPDNHDCECFVEERCGGSGNAVSKFDCGLLDFWNEMVSSSSVHSCHTLLLRWAGGAVRSINAAYFQLGRCY